MTEVKIMNMRASSRPHVLADFDAEIDGWTVNHCLIVETELGKGSWIGDDKSRAFLALMPFVSRGVRSVKIPEQHWFAFVNAALAEYDEWRDASEEPDAGLRRVLCAGAQESLTRAGI